MKSISVHRIKGVLMFFAAIVFLSCSKRSELISALQHAGSNRGELELLLDYYRYTDRNAEKLHAAEFLIKNMAGWYSYEGKGVDNFNHVVDSLFKLSLSPSGKRITSILDSVLLFYYPQKHIADLQNIKSDYLIRMIDQAFETRKYPWCKSLDLDCFCEYILPYRIGTEILEDWRSAYTNALGMKIDSLALLGATDSVVGKYLMEYYPGQIAYELKVSRPELKPTVLFNIKTGDCVDYSHLTVFLCRAFGIPASCDFIQYWGNGGAKHQWAALLRQDKKCIPFNVTDHVDYGEHVSSFIKIPSKIYRRTTNIQKESLLFENLEEDIPSFFRNPYYKDVSDEYFDAVDIEVELTLRAPKKKQIAYIMVFDNKNWQPVDWAKIKKNKVNFHKMSPLCAYMVMYYHNGKFDPASYPFYLKNDSLIELKPETGHINMVKLKRKYTDTRVKMFCKRMQGGKFQVANKADFSDSFTIHHVESIPEARFNTVSLSVEGKYKYFRYLSPKFSWGNIAEIELYNEKGDLIEGDIIGTEGSSNDTGMDKTKVFDGDVLTFFDAPVFTGAWAGLKFDKPQNISTLVYLPRNDDNFIRAGELYELFYWDGGWNSLGKQTGDADTQELIYNEIPNNALLLLRNLTKGVEERIFTYEDGKQVWW